MFSIHLTRNTQAIFKLCNVLLIKKSNLVCVLLLLLSEIDLRKPWKNP